MTAGRLHQDVVVSGASTALATVYNAPNSFAEVGLLRDIAIDCPHRCEMFLDTGNILVPDVV